MIITDHMARPVTVFGCSSGSSDLGHNAELPEFKAILRVDLFTFSKNLIKAILLFNDNIALIQIYRNVFTTYIHITICELLIYNFN